MRPRTPRAGSRTGVRVSAGRARGSRRSGRGEARAGRVALLSGCRVTVSLRDSSLSQCICATHRAPRTVLVFGLGARGNANGPCARPSRYVLRRDGIMLLAAQHEIHRPPPRASERCLSPRRRLSRRLFDGEEIMGAPKPSALRAGFSESTVLGGLLLHATCACACTCTSDM